MGGPGGSMQALAAATDGGGLGAWLFALDERGNLWVSSQASPGGAWDAWQGPKFGGQPDAGAQIACANQNNGCLMLVMVDTQGMAWSLSQTAPGGGWGAWEGPGIGGQKFSWKSIAAGQQTGPRGIQLAAVDETGGLWSCYQMNPGADWSGWTQGIGTLQGVSLGEVALGGQNNGCLMLVTESTGSLAAVPQTQPGGAWGSWSGLNDSGPSVNQICACEQGGSRGVQVWGLDSTGTIQTVFQDSAGGNWDPWQAFVGNQPATPLITIAAAGQGNGCTIFFGVDVPGNLWSVSQTAPGGGWGSWTQLTAPPES